MFTGIIEKTGTLTDKQLKSASGTLIIECGAEFLSDVKLGDSIAVNGTCLTATKIDGGACSFDVMQKTLEDTSLGELEVSAKVNLEKALRFNDRLGGHLVTGHVDGVGKVANIVQTDENFTLTIECSSELTAQMIHKGSVALEGVSLTLMEVTDTTFSLWLIPVTLEETNLGKKAIGDRVNIETDMIGKYVQKLMPGAQ